MNKIILACVLALSLVSAKAELITTSWCLISTNTVLSTLLGGGGTIKYIIVTPTNNAAASLKLYDSGTAGGVGLLRTNAAYTTITSFATNMLTEWTNYYGVSNGVITKVLMQITNTVAASTNALTPLITVTANTNTPVTYSGLNIPFSSGLNVSNAALGVNGSAGISIGYTQ